MTEGRKREVRRMLAEVGLPVTRLIRLRVGPVTLGGMGPRCRARARARGRSSPCARPRAGSLRAWGIRPGTRGRSGGSAADAGLRGPEGAIVAAEDTPSSVMDATARLLEEILRRNEVQTEDLVSIPFTATEDLRSAFPRRGRAPHGSGASCRSCAAVIPVDGSMPRSCAS